MAADGGGLCELFADDLFSILETWEECINGGSGGSGASPTAGGGATHYEGPASGLAVSGRPTANVARRREGRNEEGGRGGDGGRPAQKKQKVSSSAATSLAPALVENEGAAKISHITVERNRRKQMNEHLAVLRSLMPCFYVKRGDQASIIGGVVDYIKELQQVLRSLEAKKNRKAYADQVLSPRLVKSTPPISPRLAGAAMPPISPRTPTPGSPYKPAAGGGSVGARPPQRPAAAAAATSSSSAAPYSMSPAMTPTSSSSTQSYSHSLSLSPQPAAPAPSFLPTLDSLVTELAAHAAARGRPLISSGGGVDLQLVPDVKVEFAGPNLVVKTVSHRSPGQALKIIAALESLSLEILHVSISTVDDTAVLSFTIKIGIECELSAEELVQEIQQTFL